MQPVQEIVTELFMLVLCAVTAPSDAKEFTIDLISRGRVETVLVRRAEGGYVFLDKLAERVVERGYIKSVPDKPGVLVVSLGSKEHEIDLSTIESLAPLTDGEERSKLLSVKGGEAIRFTRSSSVLYLQPKKGTSTYVVH